ncbi:DinB family protein [Chitinophaga dinghuensis]|uniref:DinB family protein n=1 Tax=Chitinophaga dinghuensis TaxID=1539050 RepID=A0A327VUX2_9BACT|nr:DinB family protein [Chitinophaga dinghuensis]RAJ79050.1 DinB family protein [Chitinophaga dinghuensis]
MTIASSALIASLQELTREHISFAQALQKEDLTRLNWREHNNSWSMLECIAHLNRYGDFYHPAISKSLRFSITTPATLFKSGVIGNYFVKLITADSKMKTPKPMNPIHQELTVAVIAEFIQQQETMLALLEQAASFDLNRVRTSISLTKWIRLKLGDTLRFVIYHNMRHLKQIERIRNVQDRLSARSTEVI